MGAKTRVLVADFETTTDPNDCRVWAYGWVDISTPEPEHVAVGIFIEDFFGDIMDSNSICYFHNLKWDAAFILHELLTNGFTHTVERDLLPRQFSTIISDMGMYYAVKVCWPNGVVTEFRDSLKKLSMSVDAIGRTYDLPILKGSIDYDAPREIGYLPTEEEWEYVRHDVSIVAYGIKQFHDIGATRLTIGSDTLADFKKSVKNFRLHFPEFSEDLDAEIRRAYRGGFTYADERFVGVRQGKGLVLDVNSLYPSVMINNILPYGEPAWFDDEFKASKTRPLAVFTVTFVARLKPEHIPCIQIKNSNRFVETEYLKKIDEPVTLTVTNIDWDLYNEHYKIDVIEYHGGWAFKAVRGLFDDYISKWAKIKEESTGGMYQISKLYQNSLYGKFASRPDIIPKIPYLKDGVVRLKLGKEETRAPVYTAVGVFITAWARDKTIRAAQANYDVFAYADTDSLHLLTDTIPDSLDMDQKRIGAWSHEYDFESVHFIRAKAYITRLLDGSFKNAIAGLPRHLSETLTFDDIVDGKIIEGKKTVKTVQGGCILVDTPYQLKL